MKTLILLCALPFSAHGQFSNAKSIWGRPICATAASPTAQGPLTWDVAQGCYTTAPSSVAIGGTLSATNFTGGPSAVFANGGSVLTATTICGVAPYAVTFGSAATWRVASVDASSPITGSVTAAVTKNGTTISGSSPPVLTAGTSATGSASTYGSIAIGDRICIAISGIASLTAAQVSITGAR